MRRCLLLLLLASAAVAAEEPAPSHEERLLEKWQKKERNWAGKADRTFSKLKRTWTKKERQEKRQQQRTDRKSARPWQKGPRCWHWYRGVEKGRWTEVPNECMPAAPPAPSASPSPPPSASPSPPPSASPRRRRGRRSRWGPAIEGGGACDIVTGFEIACCRG